MAFNFLFHKLKRVIGMRIYCNDSVWLMELKAHPIQSSDAEIKAVTMANVEDARYFQSERQVDTFKRFLVHKDKGYYAYLNGNCIHRSWVVAGPDRVLLHKFYSLLLEENEIFIQFCETAGEARGKNVFTHVLSHIGSLYPSQKVITSVDVKNSSSIRSMTKAGFEAIDLIKIKVILGVKFISREPAARKI